MPRYIVKLVDKKNKNKAYYLEWSTVVDAPVTFGMSLREFRAYYQDEYGKSSMNEFENRMVRVQEKGTSSHLDDSAEEVLQCNRAGKNEKHMSMEQIIEWYCRKKQEPK